MSFYRIRMQSLRWWVDTYPTLAIIDRANSYGPFTTIEQAEECAKKIGLLDGDKQVDNRPREFVTNL